MTCHRLVFSGHAVRRMFERGIRECDVRRVVESGQVIAEYPDDRPFPSCLIVGYVNDMPLHVVVAMDSQGDTCHIVTVYIPDPRVWHSEFKRRRQP